jgi:hypothetical protein
MKKLQILVLLFFIVFGSFSFTYSVFASDVMPEQHYGVDSTKPHIHTPDGVIPLQTLPSQPVQQNVVVWSVVSGVIVGLIMLLATYFLKKGEKVDDIAAIYVTKAEFEKLREKMENAITKDACKNMRSDCAGKNWAESFKRMEDTFNAKLDAFDRKFDELNTLLLEVMKEIGYYKGRTTSGQKQGKDQE